MVERLVPRILRSMPYARRKNRVRSKVSASAAATGRTASAAENSYWRPVAGPRTRMRGIVLKQIESALKGNEKAALATLKKAAQVGLLEAPEGAGETPTLSASEREMVNELVLQRTKRRRSKSRR